jgi:hypothetical protein
VAAARRTPSAVLAAVLAAVVLAGCGGPAGSGGPSGVDATQAASATASSPAGESSQSAQPTGPGSAETPAGYRFFEFYEVRFLYPEALPFDRAHRIVNFAPEPHGFVGDRSVIVSLGLAGVDDVGADETVTVGRAIEGKARTEVSSARQGEASYCDGEQTVVFRVPGGPDLDNESFDYIYKVTWVAVTTSEAEFLESLDQFHGFLAMAQIGDERPGLTQQEAESLLTQELVADGVYGAVEGSWQEVAAANPPEISLAFVGDYHGRPTYCFDVTVPRIMAGRAAVRSSGYVYFDGEADSASAWEGDEVEIGDRDSAVAECVG